jgi:hypothetical protein
VKPLGWNVYKCGKIKIVVEKRQKIAQLVVIQMIKEVQITLFDVEESQVRCIPVSNDTPMISENFEVQFCTWYFCRWLGLPGLRDKPPQTKLFRGTIFLNQSGFISNRNMPPTFCINKPKDDPENRQNEKKIMLLIWREAPIICGVFISGAKRRKICETYLWCNLENCITLPSISVSKLLGNCTYTVLGEEGGVNRYWYIFDVNESHVRSISRFIAYFLFLLFYKIKQKKNKTCFVNLVIKTFWPTTLFYFFIRIGSSIWNIWKVYKVWLFCSLGIKNSTFFIPRVGNLFLRF